MEMFIYSAVPMDEESVITAPEDLMLDIGENYFEILVTAPAGNTQTYIINVTGWITNWKRKPRQNPKQKPNLRWRRKPNLY